MTQETASLLVAATAPDFLNLNLWLSTALALTLAMSIVGLVARSWAIFAIRHDRETPVARLRRMLTLGRVRPGSYYGTAALLFAVAAGAVIWLNAYPYVSHEKGLSAYLGDLEAREGDQRVLADDGQRLRAPITDCGWDDRFSRTQLERRWTKQGRATGASPRDPYVIDYLEFRTAVENDFRRQAPSAIASLSDELAPVFAVLGALFLIAARGLLRAPTETSGFAPGQVVLLALLAHAFSMLAYFAILEYHVGVEISRALASGRIVCADHVSELFVAQLRALFVAGMLLFAIISLAPGPILSRL